MHPRRRANGDIEAALSWLTDLEAANVLIEQALEQQCEDAG